MNVPLPHSLISCVLLAACTLPANNEVDRPQRDAPPTATEALILLEEIPRIDGDWYHYDAPYSRAAFGESWIDVDENRCNQRDDVLAVQLRDVVLRENGCYVDSGILEDPYTGATIAFVRGPDTSPNVHVDHVVSLWEAWGAGAEHWTEDQRIAFAGDVNNLVATGRESNEEKSNLSVSEWLPADEEHHCDFAITIVDVKHTWGLEIHDADYQALRQILTFC